MASATDSQTRARRKPASLADFSNAANGAVITFYLVPVLLFVGYASFVVMPAVTWSILILGTLVATFGSTLLLLAMRNWEYALRKEFSGNTVVIESPQPQNLVAQDPELQEELNQRYAELEDANSQLQSQHEELQELSDELAKLRQELDSKEDSSSGAREELERKDALIKEYQQTITEQRSIIEKKHHYISKLELSIKDLKYEIKTLLQLGDMNQAGDAAAASHPVIDVFKENDSSQSDVEDLYQEMPNSSDQTVRSPYDATVQLHRYVEIAKTITGARHLVGGESRFSDLSVDSYAIDLRRLYESFRSESGCMLMLYSLHESRLLFVNDQVKGLLGWSSDKFVKEFSSLVQQGLAEWKHALQLVQSEDEAQVRLIFKDKDSQDCMMHCSLARVPSGVFADHVIAVLYPA